MLPARANREHLGEAPFNSSKRRNILPHPVSGPAHVRHNSPFFQQPFRYIAAFTITLTPDSQLT